MILNDDSIAKELASGNLIISPKPMVIQPASVDLHLSEDIKYFPAGSHPIDIAGGFVPLMDELKIGPRGYFLSPGQFILGSTREWIRIPTNLVGRIEGKSSLGRIGLGVHVTAGFIDPGFSGNITLELKNVGDITIIIRPDMPISQVCFYQMVGDAIRPYGHPDLGSKYQDSLGTQPPRVVKV